jgi:hypothetical protein
MLRFKAPRPSALARYLGPGKEFYNILYQSVIVARGLCVGDRDARADRQSGELIDGIADSPLEGTGFELVVRGRGEAGCRAF